MPEPIKLAQEERWALNVLVQNVNTNQAELQRALAAENACVKLIEAKYGAVFNPTNGQFKPKPEEKKKD